MDVRCEKCGTEYELDEARLKPGGVTVKCTSCGHMFKIRKRATTNVGIPAVTARAHTNTGSGPTGERNWIIRLANGEQRTCKELATLQQWIIAGDVNRESMISRSGKTWKQLGDIPELSQFFTVADDARERRVTAPQQAAAPAQPARSKAATPSTSPAAGKEKATLLGMPIVPQAAASTPVRRAPTQPPPPPKTMAALGIKPANDAKPPATPTKPTGGLYGPPSTPKPSVPPPQKLQTPPTGAPAQRPTQSTAKNAAPPLSAPPPTPMPGAQNVALAATSVMPPSQVPASGPNPFTAPKAPKVPLGGDASERSTGAWASDAVKPLAPDADAHFGGRVRVDGAADAGFGGRIASVPTHDAAFVSGLGAPRLTPSDDDPLLDEDLGLPRRSGGVGKWIAIGALVVIAGAAVAVWLVLRPKGGGQAGAGTGSGTANAAVIDAGTAVVLADAGAATPELPATQLLDEARDALAADVGAGFESIAAQLAEGEQDGPRLALRARVATALAQQLEDQAVIAPDAKTADPLRKDAKKRIAEALPLAQKAAKIAPDDATAHVAMADVLRLQNKPAKDVQKELDRALQINPGDRDALLISALLAAREKKPADARTILTKLDSGDGALEASGDVRARWRTAMLAFAAADNPAATKAAEEVLAVQSEHVGAQKLLERLRDTVASSDPMPPEDPDPEPKHGTGSGSGSGSTTHNDPVPSGDYDSLLKKADQLAEVNCANAMPYYAKALEVKPNGVGALAGRGYCYIDAKQFSQAFSSFRAALTVSSKYEPALWGMAEAYQQQGLKDKALEAYMEYLAVYPNSAKAKKQIERLGGNASGPDEPKPDEPKPDEPKPDEPKPDEPKPDEGAGSGTP